MDCNNLCHFFFGGAGVEDGLSAFAADPTERFIEVIKLETGSVLLKWTFPELIRKHN